MGIIFSAVRFGGALLMPTETVWVSAGSIGWRRAYLYIGIIVLITSLLAAMFIKNSPEDAGTAPFGKNPDGEQTEHLDAHKSEATGQSLQAVLKSTSFYAAAIIIFSINISLHSTYTHLDVFLEMKNASLETIAFIAAFFHMASLSLLLFGTSNFTALAGCILPGFGIGALLLRVSLFAGFGNVENTCFPD